MPQKKKLQVFVSSTYTDLLEERQAAVQAILTAGHIPAGMELFAAGDEAQMDVIKHWIDESDVYMLILGGRYGSIEPKSQKSYIQLEYEYAVEKGKPLFAVVIDDNYLEKKAKKKGLKIVERDHQDKLKEFRAQVESRMVRFWSDPRDITIAIHETMKELSHRNDLTGWIPGNSAIDSKSDMTEKHAVKIVPNISLEGISRENGQYISIKVHNNNSQKSVFCTPYLKSLHWLKEDPKVGAHWLDVKQKINEDNGPLSWHQGSDKPEVEILPTRDGIANIAKFESRGALAGKITFTLYSGDKSHWSGKFKIAIDVLCRVDRDSSQYSTYTLISFVDTVESTKQGLAYELTINESESDQ